MEINADLLIEKIEEEIEFAKTTGMAQMTMGMIQIKRIVEKMIEESEDSND